MAKPNLADLTAFAAVARYRSFRQAADALGVSRSSLSHTVIDLERSLGVRLLNRTTRSVSLTTAGQHLLQRLEPLLLEFDEVLDTVADEGGTVAGTLRINGGPEAVEALLRGVVPLFLERFPAVDLEIITDGRLIDIVSDGFDAGVRLREAVPQDMIAVPLGGDIRFLAVASPDYLARNGIPETPADLARHRCIRQRLPSGKSYRWEFARHGEEIAVDVPGALTLDHNRLMVQCAVSGLGIAFVPEPAAHGELASGRLAAVLKDWCQPFPGLCVYYPGRRHVPATLRAFLDILREVNADEGTASSASR